MPPLSRADARRLAEEVRREYGYSPRDVFDPWAVAGSYGITVVPLTRCGGPNDAVRHFTGPRREALSAFLVPDGTGWVIGENDSHDLVRRRANVSHELGHVLCEHRGTSLLLPDGNCRDGNPTREREAHEVMGELLVPSTAVIGMVVRGVDDDRIADHFRVSVQMARWRANVSGARQIAARARNRRRRTG